MKSVVNDFSIRIATVNGTGSMSANNILFKTLFRMGIAASAKNLFPSNIKGLPTWYQIRVSPKGYQSMKEISEIAVWFNPNTIAEDIAEAPPQAVVIYDPDVIPASAFASRPDIISYAIPITKLTKEKVEKPKLRPLLANMMYVGAIAELFGLDTEVLMAMVTETFKAKESVIKLNWDIIACGMEYAKGHCAKQDPYRFEKQTPPQGLITIEGNTATALGALFGGCTFLSWYPITPSSSLAESLESLFKQYRHTKDGKAMYAVVQAEDELAAAGMVLGAGWAGARAMSCTSGPGISLMAEFSGYGYYTEIPAVFVDVQRVGPSTGLPTRTQQGDLTFVSSLGHGDTKHVMLFPATPIECFNLTMEAFNFAEAFQTPIFVMSDLDIGMNFWTSVDLPYPTTPIQRGKVLTEADFAKGVSFARYADVDGDGIPYRTLPNTPVDGAAYFTRGSGHTEKAAYSESPYVYERVMARLAKKFATIETKMPKPIFLGPTETKIGILGVGSSHFAIEEAMDQLLQEGIPAKYCRPLAYPFGEEVGTFINSCDHVFIVDQNRDAQLMELLRNRFPHFWDRMVSVRYATGLPIPATAITRALLQAFQKNTMPYERPVVSPMGVT